MSKKPLVPNKNPKGRGKVGKVGKVSKVSNAVKATKAPRRIRICSRLSKGRLTILIAEVDSIAKGFKGLKGFKGGGIEDDYYYDRIKGLFSDKNKEAIKRLKEDLVNDILGTMAEGLENLVIFKTKTAAGKENIDEKKKRQLLKFISIIKDIDNLGQSHIDSLISNDGLKGLPYIYKITTLVMINMFKKVYKSRYTSQQLEETPFKYLDNTELLIEKITAEYNEENRKDVLQGLTEEVKRELMYYNFIYILNDYDAKGDDNDARKIIKWMKEKCKEIEKDEFKRFINSTNINSNNFSTGCDDNNLKDAIKDYNEIIEKMKGMNEFTTPIIEELNNNSLYLLLLSDNRDTKGLLSLPDRKKSLYDLYNHITTYENEFKDIKGEYIRCVKPFFDGTLLAEYELKEELTPEKKIDLKKASVTDNEIINLGYEITRIRQTRYSIEIKQEDNTGKFYNDIPFDMTEIIGLFNILCSANTIYNQYMDANNIKEAAAKEAAAEKKEVPYEMVDDIRYIDELNNGIGGKLTTKYISTGDFVYILYEKKKIKRCVYAKAKGRGKYCKIKGDYILVSKLKVV